MLQYLHSPEVVHDTGETDILSMKLCYKVSLR